MKPWLKSGLMAATSGPARFYVLVVFLLLVFLMGGASRADVQSLILLRPAAFLFLLYALICWEKSNWANRLAPLYFLGGLAAVMFIQLIPLPPEVWQMLPNREVYGEIAKAAEIQQPWRPLSLVPSKTLNSLFSLIIPMTALCLYLNLHQPDRRKALFGVMVLLGLSASFAVLQLVGPDRGPLYLYKISNFGTPVGLFANRNHQAVAMAILLLMLGWFASLRHNRGGVPFLKVNGAVIAAVLLVPLIVITGSRAGLLLMFPALVMLCFFVVTSPYYANRGDQKLQVGRFRVNFSLKQAIVGLLTLALLLLIALTILMSRSLAFDRLFERGILSDLREQIAPILQQMALDYLPLGSGFGSFERVYKTYETTTILRPTYMNQAHNDWMQLAIEGGVPAMILLLFFILWSFLRMLHVMKNGLTTSAGKTCMMSALALTFLAAASIGDYPLRVPITMVIAALMVGTFLDFSDPKALRSQSSRKP